MTNSKKANFLIVSMFSLGAAILVTAGEQWRCADPPRFVCYFLLSIISSGMKVTLPSINGTMSVAFLFALLGIEELSFPETILMLSTATLVQCVWQSKKRPTAVQILFNVSNIAVAVYLCNVVYTSTWVRSHGIAQP